MNMLALFAESNKIEIQKKKHVSTSNQVRENEMKQKKRNDRSLLSKINVPNQKRLSPSKLLYKLYSVRDMQNKAPDSQ